MGLAIFRLVCHFPTSDGIGKVGSKPGKARKGRKSIENWQMNTGTIGLYGNFYLKRAIIALIA